MKKIILVDGNNLLFRSYYATAYRGVIMKNSKGFPTNALYGFINMMNKIISDENPSYIMVAFDKGKTFRHEKYDNYKGGRSETPDELKMQFPKSKEVLEAMGIKHFEIDNYEADDIIGTLSKMSEADDSFNTTIISSDKDLLQLITDQTTVKLLKQTGHIMMTKDEFRNTYSVDPIKMIDIKALSGDSSDQIPGVKGIGEKTAISLLEKYGSLDGIYSNIENITGKTKEKLILDKDNAYMSYDLATIYRDIELGFGLDDFKYDGYDSNKFISILEELEFNSLIKKYRELVNFSSEEIKEEVESNINVLPIDKLGNKEFSFYVEIRGEVYSKSEIQGIGIYDGENGYFIKSDEIEQYSSIFTSDVVKSCYDLKKNIVILNELGVSLNGVTFDTMIAAYILDYIVKDDISFLAQAFDVRIGFYDELYGTLKRPKYLSDDELSDICIKKAKFIHDSKSDLLLKLDSEEQTDLFYNIEMPLVSVLADMEITGIKIDTEYLSILENELNSKMELLESEIYSLAGREFNIMSPAQLGKVLFEEMEIKYPKKVKDNKYSTSKDILDKISDEEIVIKVLEYRTLSKLYSNYAVGLKNEVRDDGRIHTIFNQTLTRTGRLSSVSPNLQNIPIRNEFGRLIRKAFVADDNSLLLAGDYSQVELRIFAHMSNATNLIEAFNNNLDIHTKTASDIFKVGINDVTKDMRRTAKAVNFGILYGISSFGLSEDLGIDMKTASEFITNYLDTYPGIKEYMDKQKSDAYKFGFVKTLMNRKRYIEELKNKNFMIRSSGERMALNTPIQGSSADILKKAMIEIYNKFKELGLKSKMLIQVHDELVFNCLNEEVDLVKGIVIDIMENTYKLDVPLKVEVDMGENWYDAK